MDEYHMARRVLMAEVNGWSVRERRRLVWTDGVKVALGNSTVKAVHQRVKDRKECYLLRR